jgi:hypothetical protein
VDKITTDAVLSVLKLFWNEKPETASRLRGRIERVLLISLLEWVANKRSYSGTSDGAWMVRSLILGAAMVIGIAANAGFAPNAIGNADKSVIRIAEECGPGWWRGPEGRCHPMAKGRLCPKGHHLGPEGGRCLPN